MNKYLLIATVEREHGHYILKEYNTGQLITEKVIYATKDRAFSRGMPIGKTTASGSGKLYWKRLKHEQIPNNYIPSWADTPMEDQPEPMNLVKDEGMLPTETTELVDTWNYTDEQIRKLISDSPTLIPKTLIIDSLSWKLAIRGTMRNENLLVLGHSGCGKTLTATSLSKALNRPFFKFNMGAMSDARASLIGNTHYAVETGTFFAGSEFVKAITTPGAVILLDEYTRIHPDAENLMLTVLDKDQRYLRIDESKDTPTITVAPGVLFFATANVGVEYTSTRLLDRATKDRFGVTIEVPLLTKDQEIKLMRLLYPKLNRNYINSIADISDYTRTEISKADAQLSTIISTRSNHEQCELAMDGFRFSEIMEGSVFNLFSNEGGVDSERAHIKIKAQQHSDLDNESPLKSENFSKKEFGEEISKPKNLFDKETDAI